MQRRLGSLALASLTLLVACSSDVVGPIAATTAGRSALLAPNEGVRVISDTTDAAGNSVMVAEYAAGVYNTSDTTSASVASVTIKTVIPRVVSGSTKSCITSSIMSIATTEGWTSAVRKPGGCDREISVDFANRATGQSAQFSFLYKFGSTRIDSGLIR